MGRTFVIGDVHAGKRALEQVIQRASVDPKDHLIFLGDYVDAWSEASETIDFLMELSEWVKCTFIRGNHDDLCLNYLKWGDAPLNWLMHGGSSTKESYDLQDSDKKEKHIKFLENLEDYRLDNQNRLFLHAGFTNLRGVEHEYFSKMFYWDRTLWELAEVTEQSELNELPPRLRQYHEIYIGHTPISKSDFVQPKKAANVWNLDTGAAFMGAISILDIDSKEFWQSDAVHVLYPDEKGRNMSPK